MTVKIRLIRDSRGATAIEYSIVAAFIAIAIIAAVTGVGDKLRNISRGGAVSSEG